MKLCYETERLYLKILQEDSVPAVLDFYKRSREAFEPWEPDLPASFFTSDHQTLLLRSEFQLALRQASLRFWVFSKKEPDKIIGTISFQNITRSVYQSCHIGYKFDPAYWHQGYASEGIRGGLSFLFREWKLHRVEAFVQPDNTASIQLLERLGFCCEGISRSCIYLHGSWKDHLRYSIIHP